jgi:hypothetical protein
MKGKEKLIEKISISVLSAFAFSSRFASARLKLNIDAINCRSGLGWASIRQLNKQPIVTSFTFQPLHGAMSSRMETRLKNKKAHQPEADFGSKIMIDEDFVIHTRTFFVCLASRNGCWM